MDIITDLRPPQLDPSLIELYKNRMDSALKQKLEDVIRYLKKGQHKSQIISIGAGTGSLESNIATIFGNVITLDYQPSMFNKNTDDNVHPVVANAIEMPFKPDSADNIIASSVIHEIASFGDNRSFGSKTEAFFREALRVLKEGEVLIVRDFLLPPNHDQVVFLKPGVKKTAKEADPYDFLDQFLKSYKGHDILEIKKQYDEYLNSDRMTPLRFRVPMREALELMIHYSWSQRQDEMEEQYFYKDKNGYVEFVNNSIENNSQYRLDLIGFDHYIDPGYPDHINERFNLFDLNDTPIMIPPIMGVMAFRKVKKL